MRYPLNWPQCPICDDYALDGHITCGRVQCDEGEQRRKQAANYALRRILEEAEKPEKK
jgi:hypothetical protein